MVENAILIRFDKLMINTGTASVDQDQNVVFKIGNYSRQVYIASIITVVLCVIVSLMLASVYHIFMIEFNTMVFHVRYIVVYLLPIMFGFLMAKWFKVKKCTDIEFHGKSSWQFNEFTSIDSGEDYCAIISNSSSDIRDAFPELTFKKLVWMQLGPFIGFYILYPIFICICVLSVFINEAQYESFVDGEFVIPSIHPLGIAAAIIIPIIIVYVYVAFKMIKLSDSFHVISKQIMSKVGFPDEVYEFYYEKEAKKYEEKLKRRKRII
jgi:hypothetical protein